MRKIYLICYDISDVKVYRKVHKLVKGYAVGGQKSCFECWLTESEKQILAALIEQLFMGTAERADFFELNTDYKAGYYGIASKNTFNPFFIF